MVSRALERTGSDRHPPSLTSGVATSIGSLPHRDAHEAAAFVIATHADLPAAPQLPRRSPRERMVAQGAAGIDGVTVDATGVVRITHALCTEALVASTFDDGWGGTLAFLDVIAGRRKPVKLQLTGPVTLGLALLHAGADASVAFRVAGRAVAARAAALVRLAGSVAPDVPLVVFIDEPGLGAAGHPGFPLPAEGDPQQPTVGPCGQTRADGDDGDDVAGGDIDAGQAVPGQPSRDGGGGAGRG